MPSGIADKSIEDTLARFHQSYTIVDDCWLWNKVMSDGYGSFGIKKSMKAHRASLILHNIPIPKGHVVRHKCPKKHNHCVNPAHLTPGTQKENMEDKIEDGTVLTGELNPAVKLTETQVLEIRKRHTESLTVLSKDFGVNRKTIYDVIKRKTWKHI